MLRTSRKDKVKNRANDAGESAGDFANRTAELATQAAERATALAQTAIDAAKPMLNSARENASPVVRRSASNASGKLSGAAERAAVVLADTADRLSDDHARPVGKKAKRRRKVKGFIVISALVGGVVAFLKSPFCGKLRDKWTGGPYPDEYEPEPITVPAGHDEDLDDVTADLGGTGAPSKQTEHAENN